MYSSHKHGSLQTFIAPEKWSYMFLCLRDLTFHLVIFFKSGHFLLSFNSNRTVWQKLRSACVSCVQWCVCMFESVELCVCVCVYVCVCVNYVFMCVYVCVSFPRIWLLISILESTLQFQNHSISALMISLFNRLLSLQVYTVYRHNNNPIPRSSLALTIHENEANKGTELISLIASLCYKCPLLWQQKKASFLEYLIKGSFFASS